MEWKALSDALAEAIKNGSQLAYPALMGYYLTRMFESAIFPISWGILGYTVFRVANRLCVMCETDAKLRAEKYKQ